MKWIAAPLLLVALASPAMAQDEKPEPREKKTTMPEKKGQGSSSVPVGGFDKPFDGESYRAQEEIGMEPEMAFDIRQGLELLYLRKYEESREHFAKTEEKFPNSGLAAVSDTLVWQALMMENFDFKFDKQYWTSSKNARADLQAALKIEGNEAWEHFLMAGIAGIESIHTMRKSQYLQALNLAFEAMDQVERSRQASPGFTDLILADGMYNYWRTVVTESSSVLPDFADHKQEGLAQMKEVENGGLFLGPPATLALAFSLIEESDSKGALGKCLRNKRAYPDNVINNLVTGSVQVSMRKYEAALGEFNHILEVSPDNQRARYWKGLALQRSGRLDEALSEYRAYLGGDYMEEYQQANAHYRIGQIYYRQKKYSKAEEEYKTAAKLTGHEGSKNALDRMKKAKKSGKIQY